MASNSEIAQKSFNPSWMQASPLKMPKSQNGMHRVSNDEDDMEMMEPVFAKNRYGREDILALIPKDSTDPPSGLNKCAFFVEKPLMPIILTSLSETEQRLQQNINSSKALSAAHRNEWQGSNDGSNSPQTNNPWTIAGSSRSGYSSRGASNRWPNNSNDGGRTSKPYAGFGRPAYGAGNNGPDKQRPAKGAWSETNGFKTRQHLKSGGEDLVSRNDEAEQPKVLASDAWSAWRSSENKFDKQKSAEPTKPPTTFNRASEISKNEPTPKENIWSSTLHNSVWSPPSETSNETEKPSNNLTHSAATSLDQNERSKVPVSQSNPNDYVESDQWHYLDPTDTQRGPFSSDQMQAWFTSGYFQTDLRVRYRTNDFSTLGELIKKNGALNPFANSKSVEASPSPSASTNATQPKEMFGSPEIPIETIKILEVKERMIAEEQRKLQEKEAALKREEREREEKNAALFEMQQQLERQRQEMENRAREQERELEIRRMQILEYERQQREKLEKLAEDRKVQLQQEEMTRRRMAEMELAQQEKRRQELLMQAEIKQQEEKRQLELQLKKQEAEKAAAAEQLAEYERRQRAVEYERLKALEAQKQMLQQQQLAQQQLAQQQLAQQKLAATKAAPWSQQAPGKPTKASNFYEIQEQERIESLRRQQAEEEKRRELEAIQKRTTNNVQGNGNPWNVVKPTTKPVPIPPAKEPQQKQAPAKTVQKQSPVKVAKKTDPLTDWVIERIRQINPSVDSEVFATFLMSIESPNEVEDYILSCFGETKAAKQLHQEFLAKRIELRPRRGAKKEDDLSAPAQAITTENPSSSGTKGGKKSKKGKKVDVSAMMNFRPIGDASRFNAGEIDLELPAASKKGKKK